MRTVLVSGGSRGIGRAIVKAFCEKGCRVVFFYEKNEEAARSLQEECGALPMRCSVSSTEDVNAACAEAFRQLGHIDVLVCNAGIAQQKLFTDLTDEDWSRMIDVNLTGAFRVCRAVLPPMLRRKSGRIVTIGSIWGQIGASCEVHYSAAKAGLIGMTKALAKEVAPSGITVNCVCPGVIDTDMLACFSAEEKAALAEETPAGRLGTPEDVARCVMWLADENADFITGQVIGVNGGFGE